MKFRLLLFTALVVVGLALVYIVIRPAHITKPVPAATKAQNSINLIDWDSKRPPSRPFEFMKVDGKTLVPLRDFLYFGFTPRYFPAEKKVTLTSGHDEITLRIGSRQAITKNDTIALPIAPRLITMGGGKGAGSIAYPYLPLFPLAKMAGFSVEERKGHLQVTGQKSAPAKKYPFELLTGQKVVMPLAQDDGRVQATPRFEVDKSRAKEYASGDYIAQPRFDIKVTGSVPVQTGNFAVFIRTEDGMVYGMEHNAQSMPEGVFSVAPGKTFENGYDPLIPLRTNKRVTDLIYCDGISYFSWPVE